MASPLTLEQLAYLAGERADMLTQGATDIEITEFINESSLVYFVNIELAALWDHLILSNEDWATKRFLITLQNDVEDYSMPSDFYKLRQVFPLDSNGVRGKAMKRFTLRNLGKDDIYSYPVISSAYETQYRLVGHRLFFDPIPTSNMLYPSVEVWYYHDYPHIENDDDLVPFYYPKGWEDYVVEGVAARLKEKLDEDSGPYIRRQKEVLMRVLQVIQDRDLGEPHSMIDTSEDWY